MKKILKFTAWLTALGLTGLILTIVVNYVRFKQALGEAPDAAQVQKIFDQVRTSFPRNIPPEEKNRIAAYAAIEEGEYEVAPDLTGGIVMANSEISEEILSRYSFASGRLHDPQGDALYESLRDGKSYYDAIKSAASLPEAVWPIQDPGMESDQTGLVRLLTANGTLVNVSFALNSHTTFTLAYCNLLIRDRQWSEAVACFDLNAILIDDFFAKPRFSINALLALKHLELWIPDLHALLQFKARHRLDMPLPKNLWLEFSASPARQDVLQGKRLVRDVLLTETYNVFQGVTTANCNAPFQERTNLSLGADPFGFWPDWMGLCLFDVYSYFVPAEKNYIMRDVLALDAALSESEAHFSQEDIDAMRKISNGDEPLLPPQDDVTALEKILTADARPSEWIWKHVRKSHWSAAWRIMLERDHMIALRTAFDLHDYFLKHGGYPDTLIDLDPAFYGNAAIPTQLAYRKSGQGYELRHLDRDDIVFAKPLSE